MLRLATALALATMLIAPANAQIWRHGSVGDGRPRAWCGWQLRQELRVADRSYNRAINWAHYGVSAGGPQDGVIVVWPHHVGRIVHRCEGGWVVHSGNDGGRVRERCRSLRGVIAFRSTGGFGVAGHQEARAQRRSPRHRGYADQHTATIPTAAITFQGNFTP